MFFDSVPIMIVVYFEPCSKIVLDLLNEASKIARMVNERDQS